MPEAIAGNLPAAVPVTPASEAPESPSQADYRAAKHRVKIEGREAEVPYDELVRGYQTSKVSTQRLQEAADMKKKTEALLGGLSKGDREQMAKVLGGKEKLKEWAENYLWEEYSYEKLTDEEKEFRSLKEENKSLKQRQEDEKKRQEDAEFSALEERAAEELDVEISEALKALGRRPTPRLVLRVIDEIQARLEVKDHRMGGKDALDKAVKGIHGDLVEFLSDMPVEEAVKVLPKKLLDGIRRYEVSQVIEDSSRQRAKPSGNPTAKPAKRVGIDDWFKNRDVKLKKQK
jgi:hypothetical protein